MPEIRSHQNAARGARAAMQEAEDTLRARRNRLTNKRNQLALALRQGDAGRQTVDRLEQEIRTLEAQAAADGRALSAARARLTRRLSAFPGLDRPWELVEQLDDNLPFLLLPVRIETRFMTVGPGRQLWVRIFPDDVAVSTHEENLTANEIADGATYWRQRWQAAREANEAARETMERGAWRVLASARGETRAAWIVRETKPATLDVPGADALVFPQRDPEALDDTSWSRAPRSRVMPDRFVVMAYTGGQEILRALGNPIPNPLFVGPDPQTLEDEFRQQDGELLVGDDIAWIYDFDRAVAAGMGLRIPLQEPHASRGFDRLLVLGLRLTSDEHENQALLDALFEGHHYAPDGMSLLEQGTPTNNTEERGSGFTSANTSAETSFAEETGDVLFEPTETPLDKTDGQRLVEALGTSHEPWQRIRNSGQRDVGEAVLMNRALWHGTVRYYLETLLELDPTTIGLMREFFTNFVSGRGPLPAIRVGSQPYGILLTSDFAHWQFTPQLDGDRLPFLDRLYAAARRGDAFWRSLLPSVPRVGGPGDPQQNLLSILGLNPCSVEHNRRRAVGKEYVWNYLTFLAGASGPQAVTATFEPEARLLAEELGWDPNHPPRLFDLAFFNQHDKITDPLVDDIAADETENLSESRQLRSAYAIPDPTDPEVRHESNYIGWLVRAVFDDVKNQHLENLAGDVLSPPRPVLYRMLRGALVQAYYDASAQLYGSFGLLASTDQRELELNNVRADRTVTRWELMDADVSRVMPQLSQQPVSVAGFLQSDAGQSRPEALGLNEVRQAIDALVELPTARLERIFVEHLDLCTYRLDAWQTGFFARRLQQQRFPAGAEFESRIQGIHLGAFGWLEDVRPATPLVPVDAASLPVSLHDPQRDGSLFEQPDNGGFIHAPSLHHAVVAAVLRNAYVTHFDPAVPEKMAVNLSSARVRTALDFLDGIRNGQDLGALLGYQFERGLHDRHGDPSLNQYILPFRQKYPMVADRITEDANGTSIETKEAHNVLDGYALAEAALLRNQPLPYPYDVQGLPADPASAHARAIQDEVSRLADTLDAIADLALAEGVYQAVQGNFDRAAGMLKAVTEGHNPPEPEIVRTPRSGTAVIQRLTLHLPPVSGGPSPWPGQLSPRAKVEPNLNRWLADILPPPHTIKFRVGLGEVDAVPVEQDLTIVGLQPIDLVYLIGDELTGETTELERRIAHENRRREGDDSLLVRIDVMTGFADAPAIALFALLPLLRALREIVTGSRALAADDFLLPSEATSDPSADANPKGYDLDEIRARVSASAAAFRDAVDALALAIPPADADGHRDLTAADPERLRAALRALADFGVPDAFPRSAFGNTDEARSVLVSQAISIQTIGARQQAAAAASIATGEDATLAAAERASRYGDAAKQIFGPAFNLIPGFGLKNGAELQAAATFRDAGPAPSLTRHHQGNPHIVDEWLQGVSRVRDRVGTVESVFILGEAVGQLDAALKPLQLPYREQDHWVGMTYPDSFVPEGEFLSIVQWLPPDGFDPQQAQRGLVIDEWAEVIPGTRETTGIAVHYDQPSTEPPQVLLLAVTPVVTGAWTWDKLVGVLNDTIDRAKLRAVEPDQLGRTALGQMLPAVVSAVASHPRATISTDFVHVTAIND